jgi:hypothetical protein
VIEEMLHHHEESQPENELRTRQTRSLETPAEIAPLHDPQIEDFLDRVFARLVVMMPYEERQARRAAMREQVLQYAAANVELGVGQNEAVALALAQVQREQAVATQAIRPIHTLQSQTVSARAATGIALGFFGLFYLLDQTTAAGHLWHHFISPLYAADGSILRNTPAVTGFYRFELFVLPILCGLCTGLLARNRPVRGTLNALAILAVPAIAWAGAALGLQYANVIGNGDDWTRFVFPNPIPAVCGIGFWALLGSLSAGAGGLLRRRLVKARVTARSLAKGGRRILRRSRSAIRRDQIVNSHGAPV